VTLILGGVEGCSTTRPSSEVPTPASYLSSRNGLIFYRLPAGWFDATADFQSSRILLWLMRNDYAGSIVIKEVTLDAAAREGMERHRLLRLAQLTMSLATASTGATVVREPDVMKLNGKLVCSYETMTSEHDTTRVLLLDTGSRVLEVRALAEGRSAEASAADIFSTQETLVKELRW
jgi:hypothetical protein